jgi:hypothetical protein
MGPLVLRKTSPSMQEDEFERLRAKHEHLLSLCKSGPKKLRAARDEREFCALCAANDPELDAVVKLYSLKDEFLQHAPPPPQGDELAAQAYLKSCKDWVAHRLQSIPAERMRETARKAVREFGTHFSGKLVNSNAQQASRLATARATAQPHVSSRSLLAAKIKLPLDQSKLDNRGVYRRIVKILEGDPLMDGAAVPVPAEHIEAIRAGAEEAIREAAACRIPLSVDHRLRQVLLPIEGEYIAVTPLPAAGLAHLWHKLWHKRLDADPEERKEERKKKYKLDKVSMPVGGTKTQNTTRLPANAIQEQLLFRTPQRNQQVSALWGFVYRTWQPYLGSAQEVIAAIHKLSESDVFGDSASVKATKAQASGPLWRLVVDCHRQASELAKDIAEATFSEAGTEVEIDERLLGRYRTGEITALDRAILHQSFGADYRHAMASTIVRALRTKARRPDGTDPLMGESDRKRVVRAIETLLERV